MGTTSADTYGCSESWAIGSRPYFEYHCYEGHDSADAQLWYHSHQQVTVLRRNVEDETANGVEGYTFVERSESGAPANYTVRFDDGVEGCVMEDELLTGPEHYTRPNAPVARLILNADERTLPRVEKTGGYAGGRAAAAMKPPPHTPSGARGLTARSRV